MAVWLVRAGKNGEDESRAIDKGLAIVGREAMLDLACACSYEEMKKKHEEYHPELSPKGVSNNAARLWGFVNRIKPDDLVLLPLKTTIAGGTSFKKDMRGCP